MGAVFTPEYLAARADRQRALYALHTEWSLGQVAQGLDGPVPADRPARSRSDFNQHVPDMEAPGLAEDEFDRLAREIMGLPLLVAEPERVVVLAAAVPERVAFDGCWRCGSDQVTYHQVHECS